MPSSTRAFKTMVNSVSVPPQEYIPHKCQMTRYALYANEMGWITEELLLDPCALALLILPTVRDLQLVLILQHTRLNYYKGCSGTVFRTPRARD